MISRVRQGLRLVCWLEVVFSSAPQSFFSLQPEGVFVLVLFFSHFLLFSLCVTLRGSHIAEFFFVVVLFFPVLRMRSSHHHILPSTQLWSCDKRTRSSFYPSIFSAPLPYLTPVQCRWAINKTATTSRPRRSSTTRTFRQFLSTVSRVFSVLFQRRDQSPQRRVASCVSWIWCLKKKKSITNS